MGQKLEHPDPDRYAKDLKDARDEFEEALKVRYESDLKDSIVVWTPHGSEPDPPPNDPYRTNAYTKLLNDVPSWVAEVRPFVGTKIAEYATQDLNKLQAAFDNLHSAARLLGEDRAVGDDGNIPSLTRKINGRSGDAADFTAWAGIGGEEFKNNFGQLVRPTMENQAKIATSLLNLYSGRACIIEAVRNNNIDAFKRATKRLGETVDSGKETIVWSTASVLAIGLGFITTGGGAVSLSA